MQVMHIKDNVFEYSEKENQEPDFDDPEWYKKVTDWGDFWNYQRWTFETQDLDGETDASGKPVRDLVRLVQLLQGIKSIEARHDVINWMTPMMHRKHIDNWTDPPEETEKQPELVVLDINDARALAEKRRKRELMDLEWQRRKSKLGKIPHQNYYRDVRMQLTADERRAWTDEEVRNLITNHGAACAPEDHKAYVENPLVVVDWVNTHGVQWVEDTEDFLERIGHMATPDDRLRLDDEVVIDLLNSGLPEDEIEEILSPEVSAREREIDEAHINKDNTWHGDQVFQR